MEERGREELRKYILFKNLIRTTSICKRLCSLAWIDEEYDYDYIMIILLDYFRSERVAKKIYNKLKAIGFIEETIVKDLLLGPELQNPKRSKRFLRIMKKYGINDIDQITPEIARMINENEEYFVEVSNSGVKVFPKLDVIKIKLSHIAKEVCRENTEPI